MTLVITNMIYKKHVTMHIQKDSEGNLDSSGNIFKKQYTTVWIHIAYMYFIHKQLL